MQTLLPSSTKILNKETSLEPPSPGSQPNEWCLRRTKLTPLPWTNTSQNSKTTFPEPTSKTLISSLDTSLLEYLPPSCNESCPWILCWSLSRNGIPKPSISRPNGNEQNKSQKETNPPFNICANPSPLPPESKTLMQWMLMSSALESLSQKRENIASRRDCVSTAEKQDT